MSRILLYLSSTIIVLKHILLYLSSKIIVLKYLSSTGWLKAGYGLVMMMMMKMMLLMMTLDRKNMIQVRVSDRKGKEIDQSSMLKPSIYTVTLPRVRAERQMF